MSAPTLVKCSKCGELMVPHRVCKNCGSYNKKEIIAVINFRDRRLSERSGSLFSVMGKME